LGKEKSPPKRPKIPLWKHSKGISDFRFCEHYLPNIDTAIERAKYFETKEEELIYKIGTNLPKLFAVLRKTT
jgi:hypothetical protein